MFEEGSVKHGQKGLGDTVGPRPKSGTNTSGENHDLHGPPSIHYAMKAAALMASMKNKYTGS
tara:strand:+ start:12367 stop:12552 length:186 start_codon:yes stop_codon:yes gene_type:complete